MIIWFALIIPIFTAVILFVFFNHYTKIWEFFIPFLASLALISIMKITTESCQTSDTEYWGEKIVQAIYSEEWDEEVSCKHEISCTHEKYCKDNEGKEYQCGYEHSNDGYYHMYDVDNHPEYWEIKTEFGNTSSISKAEYNRLVKKWDNQEFVNKNRDYHSINGDWFVTNFNNSDEKIECFVTNHSYENRVQASDNVFNFPEVLAPEIKMFNLYEYPKINGYKQKGILGIGDSTQSLAENKVQIINAKLGPNKQVKLFILVFRNLPEEAAYFQECLWKGGNKNEFVVCIGIDSISRIKWCKPFSFTENLDIKINTRNFVKEMKVLNLYKVTEFLQVEIYPYPD
jgi:hypothetical protein